MNVQPAPVIIWDIMFLLIICSVLRLGFSCMNLERAGSPPECQSRQRIHYEVYPQDLDNGQRIVNSDERADEADENRRNVDGELEYNELPDGVEMVLP